MGEVYEFEARNKSGVQVSGEMEAPNKMVVIQTLNANDFIPTYIELKKNKQSLFTKKIPLKELAVTCRQLSAMTRTGVPIIDSLETIRNETKNKKFKEILASVISDISNGNTLADAFNKHHQYFPSLFIRLLYSAEVSGELDHVLETLSDSFEKDVKIRAKLRNAFSYPLFILVFAIILISTLIIFVLPTFVDMFSSSQTEPPLITKMMLAVNQFVLKYWFFIVLSFIIVMILLSQSFKTKGGRKKIDYFITKLPIFGDIVRKNLTFRFSQTLHDLYTSGVSIEKSLQIVSEVVNNRYLEEKLQEVRIDVIEGGDMSRALQKVEIFPHILISMVRIGESSGELDKLLKDVCDYCEEELRQKIDQVTSYIEPFLLIIIGLLVGSAIIGILLPMYDGMTNIH